MTGLASTAAGIAASFFAVHCASAVLAARQCRPKPLPGDAIALPPITLVRPLCGLEPFTRETLRSSFALDYPQVEILFCLARADDPVAPLVRQAIADHPATNARLLIGEEPLGDNPKLNNMAKGWREARYDHIAFVDSNVLMPPDFLRRLAAAAKRDVVVSAPPAGTRPDGFAAMLECAFLNTYEAKWQYCANALGMGFAQGKTLFFPRHALERGGLEALASEPAEDAATTKLVRRRGLRIELVPPSPQPLGRRSFRDVWARQLRWARLRRATFPLEFLPEIATGSVLPSLVAFVAAREAADPLITMLLFLAAWYAVELSLARACRWPLRPLTLPALLLRDCLLPALWVGALAGSSYTWKGTHIAPAERTKLRPKLIRFLRPS